MITGIGIDLVEVARFIPWLSFSPAQLAKIFSEEEIQECAGNPMRLASRFAAKEAFFKALSASLLHISSQQRGSPLSLFFICRIVSVHKSAFDIPVLMVAWDCIEKQIGYPLPLLKSHLSLSHERQHACAIVILER